MDQKPSIGQIVHYTSLGDKEGKFPAEVQAALITKVYTEITVALKIFYKTGIFYRDSVSFSKVPAPGCWNCPPRV